MPNYSLPKKILVTGAGGFIGRNLCDRLVAEGCEVVGLSRNHRTNWRLQGNLGFEVVDCDLLDGARLRSVFDSVRPEVLVNLATYGSYPRHKDVPRMFAVNAVGSAALLELCKEFSVERFVQAGTSGEYGYLSHPARESDSLVPNSYYAVAKAGVSEMLRLAAGDANYPVFVVLRFFSVYGPWEDPFRLWPQLMLKGMSGALPQLGDPNSARDYVYVDDAVEAVLRALNTERKSRYEIYNVGSGIQTTVRELVNLTQEKLEICEEADWGGYAAASWDAAFWQADTTKAEMELGWKSKVYLSSGFDRFKAWMEDGLRLTCYAEEIKRLKTSDSNG